MATLDDVRTIAMSLPGVCEKIEGHRGGATWRTGSASFVWERGAGKSDLAQLAELGREWPEGAIVALRTDGLEGRDELLHAFPDLFFTIPHFDGYPAVLLRLAATDVDQLRELVADAWLLTAPKRVAKEWLAQNGIDSR